MNCPHWTSPATKQQQKRTTRGSSTFRCSACRCLFNERTATPFTSLEDPTDSVLLVVFWRLRSQLSLRDLAEIFLQRGFVFTQETVREWEARFAPVLAISDIRSKTRNKWLYRNPYRLLLDV